MTLVRTPDDVISSLPEWHGATWTALPGGLTNRTWKMEKNGRKAVLKIDDELRMAPYNTRLAEATLQTVAARAGLANCVLFADRGVYLTEYVEGTVWEPACFDNDANLEEIARALRRLHSLPLSGRRFDSMAAARQYLKKSDNPDRNFVAVCLGIIERVGLTNDLRCCHNDLVAENIVATPELRFLDWEFACDNDPLFDLATIVEHHSLSEEQAHALLNAYFDGSGEHPVAMLLEQRQLYLALLWLWLASRADSSCQDLRRAADRLTTSGS